jgi:hypothetical protein
MATSKKTEKPAAQKKAAAKKAGSDRARIAGSYRLDQTGTMRISLRTSETSTHTQPLQIGETRVMKVTVTATKVNGEAGLRLVLED